MPNRRLCSVLSKKQREAQQCAADSYTPAATPSAVPATLVTPVADRSISNEAHKAAPEPGNNPYMASIPKRSTRAAAQVPIKTEPKTEPRSPSQREAGKTKTPAYKRKAASLKADHKVGDRVYCKWPPNGKYYWARITKVNKRKKRESPTYNVSLLAFPHYDHY